MPTYNFYNQETKESFSSFMPIKEMEQYLSDNPSVKLQLSTPGIVDSVRVGVTKTPDSFNSLLKNIKKRYHRSTIETR